MEKHVVRWAPRRLLGALAWLFATVCAGVAALLLLQGDKAGPLLFTVATLAAATFGYYTTFARPRLAADHSGLRVRTFAGRHEFTWGEVAVTVVTTRRLGRDVRTLELDTGDAPPHLIVLGKLELDADPGDVLETLDALRPQL